MDREDHCGENNIISHQKIFKPNGLHVDPLEFQLFPIFWS